MKFPVTNNSFTALEELVCLLHDGKSMYESAIQRATDGKLKSYFNFLLNQRNDYIDDLNTLLISAGLTPQTTGTFKGKIFLQWMEVKLAISGPAHENNYLVSCCLYSERRLQQAYKELLNTADCLNKEQKFLVGIQQQGSKLALMKLHKMKTLTPANVNLRFL